MEFKLKEVMAREPTLLVMVVGVPNVGKSALINCIHRIATSRFPGKMIVSLTSIHMHVFPSFSYGLMEFECLTVHEKVKRATVGPLPGVTQDISGFKVLD